MSGATRKTLLMLCFHYPPAISGGVERSVRFVKYLPEFGWEPLVMTTDRFGSGAGRGGEQVVRVGEFSRRRRSARNGDPASRGTAGGGPPSPLMRFAEKWLLVPDKHVRWTLKAFSPALRVLKRGAADAIYTTSPPSSAHVLGLILKRLTGKPWVMDLRDPWTLEPLSWYLRTGGPRLSLERRIERNCFMNADAVVLNTPEAAEKYAGMYPGLAARFHSIPNGFDAKELESARASVSQSAWLQGIGADVFVVGHVGTLCRYSDSAAYPKGLFDAVEELLRKGLVSPDNFRMIFAGGMNPMARRRIAERRLEGIVMMTGPVSHIDALRIMFRSDLLLLYDPNQEDRYYVHGKLYEYLASGRAILGIVPPGASRRMLERAGLRVAVARDDGPEIEGALARSLKERVGTMENSDFRVSRYEGRYLASALAGILDKVGR